MANGILIKNQVAAADNRALNRSAVAGSSVDINNGSVFHLPSVVSASAGYKEVWNTQVISTDADDLKNLWVACGKENVVTTSGTSKYRGIDPDVRNFTNLGGDVFDAFKPQVGDIITLSADALGGSPSTGDYVASGSSAYTMSWTATSSASSLTFYLLEETYISLATGGIDNQRVLAYRLECVNN